MILNIKRIYLLTFLMPFFFSSCSENEMDRVNRNTNNPADVQARFILTDVLTRTAFSNVGGDLNTYLSSYVEHEVGTHNQLWDAEHRESQPQLASTFNNSWNNIYQTLRDADIIIKKCSKGGVEDWNPTTLGIAQVMIAYNLALLTDMFGDVPYSEALEPFKNKIPKLDNQEELYSKIFEYLDEALINLPKGDRDYVGGQDLLYGGQSDKWIKLAYGLKARYTLRLLNRANNSNESLLKIVEFADKSFSSIDDQASFNVYGAQNLNPLFDFQWSRNGLAASMSIADKLIEREDPRVRRNFVWPQIFSAFVTKQVDDLKIGSDSYNLLAVNGENEQLQYNYLTSIFVYSQTASTQFLSYHEVQFLKAEAMQRLNMAKADIEDVLRKAISASIRNSEKSVQASFNAPTVLGYGGVKETTKAIEDSEIDLYFVSKVKPLFDVNPLKEIAIQKYLGFSGASGESTEIYNDIRRWRAGGEQLIELKNPNKFPLRLPYGSSETTTNPNVQKAYGNGDYVYSENVWWAGGTR